MKKYIAGGLIGLALVMGATFALDQLSRKDPDGTIFGQSSTDKIGFYGITVGIVQPSGSSQGAVAATSGGATIFATTLTPAAIVLNTCAEQTFTVTGVATDQAVVVNKPTTQAGLGIGGMRVSAANTVGITFCNNTGSTITPTAGESYKIVALAGAADASGVLLNAIRSALVNLGLIKGGA